MIWDSLVLLACVGACLGSKIILLNQAHVVNKLVPDFTPLALDEHCAPCIGLWVHEPLRPGFCNRSEVRLPCFSNLHVVKSGQ